MKYITQSFRTQLPAELRAQGNQPFILAHRGCRASAPENTMAAFELALEQGAEAIETDLRITRDRVIVCIHDATVDRTTDGTGRVDQMTWDELRRLRARGNNDAAFPSACVPSLAQVLGALAGRTYLALELKAPVFTHPADAELLLKTLEDHQALDRVIALSFSRVALGCLEQAGAPFSLGYIAALNPWPPARYPMVGPWWPLLLLNPFYVAISHRRGQICCPLDPCPEPRLWFYLWLGVDALLSDHPGLTREALERRR
jgi:glycerophosphoryl diester phosphodiesterase